MKKLFFFALFLGGITMLWAGPGNHPGPGRNPGNQPGPGRHPGPPAGNRPGGHFSRPCPPPPRHCPPPPRHCPPPPRHYYDRNSGLDTAVGILDVVGASVNLVNALNPPSQIIMVNESPYVAPTPVVVAPAPVVVAPAPVVVAPAPVVVAPAPIYYTAPPRVLPGRRIYVPRY